MQVCPLCQAQCDDGLLVCPADGTSLPRAALVGRILGDRYRVLGRIGQGGMGTVYLCEHVTLGKRMAVKVLRPEFSSDEELVRRFQHEARAASQIGQENIVDVYDFGHTPEGSAYFVMEALEGESLARVLHREGPLPLGRAVRILLQICHALDAAHRRGIVHRDLKPENVFLLRRPDGTDFVKVLDFGIAKSSTSPDASRLTRAGSIIGTPEYMSPEQAAGTGADPRSDVYSLGVLAYEVLTGRLPLEGESPISTLLKHQSEAPLPPRRWRPDLPLEVEAVVLRLLAKRPESRPQTMAAVAQDLSAAVSGIDVDARPTPFAPAPSPPPRVPAAVPAYAPPPPAASRPGGERGGTMPLVELEDLVRAGATPAPAAPPAAGAPAPGSVPARRRSAQLAAAFVVGLLGVALLGALLGAVVARRGDGGGEPVATVVVEPIPAGLPAAASPVDRAADPTPGGALDATGAGAGTEGQDPASPSARPVRRKGTRTTGPGTGAPSRNGQNGGRAGELIDPYR
jgi:eukaryotic-like serine/threonine-protein kinase